MAEIKVNYTAYAVNNWCDVFSSHMALLKEHVLSKYDSELSVFAYPNSAMVSEILESLYITANVVYPKKNEYEFPAIRDLVANPLEKNLYLHTKGVTKRSDDRRVKCWNGYMTHFCIEHADWCVSELGRFDCVGVEFKEHPFPHYCGNFWWSTGGHLAKIRGSDMLNAPTDRFDAEKIVGSVGGRFLSMCDSGCNLYETPFSEDRWVRQDKTFEI